MQSAITYTKVKIDSRIALVLFQLSSTRAHHRFPTWHRKMYTSVGSRSASSRRRVSTSFPSFPDFPQQHMDGDRKRAGRRSSLHAEDVRRRSIMNDQVREERKIKRKFVVSTHEYHPLRKCIILNLDKKGTGLTLENVLVLF